MIIFQARKRALPRQELRPFPFPINQPLEEETSLCLILHQKTTRTAMVL